MKKTKEVIKADQPIEDVGIEKDERMPTEFEYLQAKVEAMGEIVGRLQAIIKQNDLKYIEEDCGEGDIEDMIWGNLNADDE